MGGKIEIQLALWMVFTIGPSWAKEDSLEPVL